jgi:hypothetical protein
MGGEAMNLELAAIYCICDDYLKECRIIGWPNEKMKSSEVMTTLITAAQFFAGNIEKARKFLKDHGYMPDMLSSNRLIERIHAIPLELAVLKNSSNSLISEGAHSHFQGLKVNYSTQP